MRQKLVFRQFIEEYEPRDLWRRIDGTKQERREMQNETVLSSGYLSTQLAAQSLQPFTACLRSILLT